MPPNLRHAEALFHEALEIDPPQRAKFVSTACGNDATLRRRVEALLAAHEQAAGFLPEGNADGISLVGMTASECIGTMIGRYKLLEKLGEGGFGEVWAAEQREPIRRRVALKIIKLGMDTKQVIARFEAERQALAMMEHPNIAKVLDAGATDSGRLYFVMELVRGIPITTYCEEQQLGTHGRLDLFIKTCQAIQHAHQKGIIHRDIKPSNVMITLHDGVPVPKVIDFGIAKATQVELTEKTVYTQLHQFIGTPAYMSPEQAEMTGLDIDTRSDIYSLGVLLYELLTGKTPFDGKALMKAGIDEMRRIIREVEPLRPSTQFSRTRAYRNQLGSAKPEIESSRLDIDDDLDWIVMKCLEKDRTRRYETANGLAMDLLRHLRDEPVVARPPSTTYRVQKAFRRNKLAFTSAAVVVAALLTALGISAWQTTVANRAREVEQQSLYAANLNRAQSAWDQNNIGQVRQLLDETAAYPDRGFEWYYWQRQAHLEVRTFQGHTDGVWAVAYSADGKRIATGSSDHTAKVWDVSTGQELHTLNGHNDWVAGIAYSPDGLRIVTASSDQTARIWDAMSGKELRMLVGHTHWVTSVAFSPDGLSILSGSHDNTAKVWDARTGAERFKLKATKDGIRPRGVSAVAYSPNGHQIATAGHDTTVKIWDALTGDDLYSLAGLTNSIWALAFSRDDRFLVAGGTGRTVSVWDLATREQIHRFEWRDISDPGISSVAFSPDGQFIIAGAWNDLARIWNAVTGTDVGLLKGHSDGVSSVSYSPNGEFILTGSRGHVAKIWNATGTREITTLSGHTHEISSLSFSPDGKKLLTGSADRTAKVWDLFAGAPLTVFDGHTEGVLSVAFSHHGQRIVTGGEDFVAHIWDVGRNRESLPLRGHRQSIACVAFSPDSRRIVTGSYDHTARVWDSDTGKELSRLLGHNGFVLAAAFSPDGQWIATGSFDGTARIWDAVTGKQRLELQGAISAITSTHPAFGRGRSLTLRGRAAAIASLAFSPDGRRLVTGSQDGTATVWDPADGTQFRTLQGHRRPISAIAFSPDGLRIITGSHDNTARLWNAANGKELLTFRGHANWITSVAFSLDGRRIATASLDGSAKVWEAATPEQVAVWQQEERSARERVGRARHDESVAIQRAQTLRAQDPGMIKQWLLLAPIPFEGTNGAKALDEEQIPNEAQLHPQSSEHVTTAVGELVWKAVYSENYLLDVAQILGKSQRSSVAYAVCYIWSDSEQDNLVMRVGSDQQSKIFLNGRLVHRRLNGTQDGRTYIADQDAVAGVKLKAGINVLVFKLVHEDRAWRGSIRFCDSADQPLKGIKGTLDPGQEDDGSVRK